MNEKDAQDIAHAERTLSNEREKLAQFRGFVDGAFKTLKKQIEVKKFYALENKNLNSDERLGMVRAYEDVLRMPEMLIRQSEGIIKKISGVVENASATLPYMEDK